MKCLNIIFKIQTLLYKIFPLIKKDQPLVIYNVNKQDGLAKRCLLIYITKPFCSKNVSVAHQNQWQAVEMARIIGEQGFIVDVADFQRNDITLVFNYDLVVGLIPRGIDIYTKHMNPGCIQVAYLTSMNLSVTSWNEKKRIEECFRRRGARLQPRRFAGYIEPRIEEFDAAWYIGNKYNVHSYDCFKMPPIYFIKNTGHVFPWATMDAERDPHCFMFFGSAGQVHKGLDLLLELFAEEIKDCTLYVCGCFSNENDFVEEYHKELYKTSNIVPVGFVNIDSQKYRELANKCAYTLLPSCAEGCAGSVLSNMSAGIIPIVSRECGLEDDEVILLPNCEKETIKRYILEYSQKEKEWIKKRSQYTQKIILERYLEKNFTESVINALAKTLGKKSNE